MATKHIKKLTSKDQTMLKNFRDVGYLKDTHMKQMGYAQNRIKKFVKDGYLEKVSFLNPEKNGEFAYRLTSKGKILCKNQLGLRNFYKSSSAYHDTALAEQYAALSEEQRDSWLTEADLRDQYDLDSNMSPPDGCYTVNGSMIAVEVVTSSYTTLDINEKIGFCNSFGLEYTQIRV